MWSEAGGCNSPVIFILAANLLTQFFHKAQSLGEIHGFKASRRSSGIPLLQYADDTMILVHGILEEATTARAILKWFELFSGLSVNNRKSVKFEVNKVDQINEILNFWDYPAEIFLTLIWACH